MLSLRCAVMVLVAALMVLQTSSAQEATTTKPCRMLKCRPDCKPGKGADGCPICDCPPRCEGYPCDDGQVCELKTVQCFRAPCHPVPTCVAAVQETPSDCPMIKCSPDCSPGKGEDRCPICDCPQRPSCMTVRCSSGHECQLVTVTCEEEPCYPQPQCVPVAKEEEEELAAEPCPMVRCASYCVPHTVDGCPSCACDGPTCENYPCDDGQVCELETVQCFTTPCYPQPRCVAAVQEETPSDCPMIKCSPDCSPGTGEGGCPSCDCPQRPSCMTVRCSSGHECQLVEVTCEEEGPCYPQPQCVPVTQEEAELAAEPCPMVRCASYCVPHTVDGCPACACDGPTCENYPCDDGQVCELETVQCFTTPCYPQPRCVAAVQEETPSPCRMIKCSPDCRPGTGPDGCPSCDCPPSCMTVKCSAGHECQLVKVICKKEPCDPQPQCVPVKTSSCTACAKNCFTMNSRKSKCPRCFCPDPCKRKRCPAGYECKLSDETSKSSRIPFIPKPYCAPKSCTTEPEPCAIRCMYGLKTDRNGCQLCECLSAPRS